MRRKTVLALLGGGDLRSIGGANEVVKIVSHNPELFSELLSGCWSNNRLISMRAADAVEKITRSQPDLLRPHKKELLGLMAEAATQELRWHLALIIPRLPLRARERRTAFSWLAGCLEDRSSIVRTFALQGLADLAVQNPNLRPRVTDILSQANRSGTPAMKARSRKLLRQLETSTRIQ